MKKLLTLMLALGVAAPQLQAQKPQSYYDNIVANVKKQTREDALKTLGALPFADQRIIMAMVAEGLADNPKEFEMFLPLALSVHDNDRARSHARWVSGAGVVSMAAFGLAHNRHVKTHSPMEDPRIQALLCLSLLSGGSAIRNLFSLMFSSTPATLANYTFKALIEKAQAS